MTTPAPTAPSEPDVLVVGGGPAGLTAAAELARSGARVVLVERAAELGGVPLECDHLGFGWRDLRRCLSGPSYARRLAGRVVDAGVETRVATTVLGWDGPTCLRTTSPDGLADLRARAVLLATGCRERSRVARMVAGSRPAGVLTTGSLQQLVRRGVRPGRRAVVVGAEHVSFSAVHALRHADVVTVAMVTEHAAHQTFGVFRLLAARGVPIVTRAQVTAIVGRGRAEAVELITPEGPRTLPCDTVVFTGDFIPDHELARAGGLLLDEATRGPRVDASLRSSVPGVFAAGNLLRGAAPADLAALEGRAAAASIRRFLDAPPDSAGWPTPLTLGVESPLAWVTPSALVPDAAPPLLQVYVADFVRGALLELAQDERVLLRAPRRTWVPNRLVEIDAHGLLAPDPHGGPVVARLR